MDIFIEVVKILAPAFVVIIKLIADNRSKRKRENTILEKQNSRISEIEKSLSSVQNDLRSIFAKISNSENELRELNEMHKNKAFQEQLFNEVTDRIYFLTKEKKIELRQMILSGFEDSSQIIKSILNADFKNLDSDIIFDKFVRIAKRIKSQINLKNIENIENKEDLLSKKNKIKQSFKTFAINLQQITPENTSYQKQNIFRRFILDLTDDICKIILA